MGDFIKGVLIENEEGATYNGKVYDRFLKLRLSNGRVLSIFDPFGPLSTGLAKGEVYEMIVIPLATAVQYFATSSSPPVENDEWQATIIETHWRAVRNHYRYACEALYAHDCRLPFCSFPTCCSFCK
jgi:hypothetical protein